MAKDGTTIAFGIIYCVIIGLCWIFVFLPYQRYSYPYYSYPYFYSLGGMITLAANGLLIPSFILYTVFYCSSTGHTSASVGFGLGLAGWVGGFVGQIMNILFTYYSSNIYVYIVLFFIFFTVLTVFGSLMFARRHKYEESMTGPSLSTRRDAPPPPPPTGPPCPECNRPTTHIAQYDRFFCYHCRKYV